MAESEQEIERPHQGGHCRSHRCATRARTPGMGRAGCQGDRGARRTGRVMPRCAGGLGTVCVEAISLGIGDVAYWGEEQTVAR
jgi:hypothetical protein